jgi:hypothetical protein
MDLKIVIAVCATVITAVNLLKNGDGISIAALFGLYGTLLGYGIGKSKESEKQ